MDQINAEKLKKIFGKQSHHTFACDARLTSGYSLFEIALTLSIVSILALIGFPYINSLYTQFSLDSETKYLYHSLNFARSQAILTQKPVSLCPSHDGKTCTIDWTNGYIIFFDDVLSHEPKNVLRSHELKLKNAQLNLSSFTPSHFFTFLPSGMSQQVNGTFTWCIKRDKTTFARSVVINRAGRVRMQPSTREGC